MLKKKFVSKIALTLAILFLQFCGLPEILSVGVQKVKAEANEVSKEPQNQPTQTPTVATSSAFPATSSVLPATKSVTTHTQTSEKSSIKTSSTKQTSILGSNILSFDDLIIIGSDNSGVEKYNIFSNTTIPLSNLLESKHEFSTATYNGKIYTFGGCLSGSGYPNYQLTNGVEEYNIFTNTWSVKKGMPTERMESGSTTLNNKIYVIGGYNGTGDGNRLTTLEEYDPVTDNWTKKSGMITGRSTPTVCTLNNKIYSIGGYSSSGPSNSTEEYDPLTDTWTSKAPISIAREVISSVVFNNKIYIFGGASWNNMSSENITEVFDPNANSGYGEWKRLADMPSGRFFSSAKVINNKIYVLGGYSSAWESIIKSIDEYDPLSNTWKTVGIWNNAQGIFGCESVFDLLYSSLAVNSGLTPQSIALNEQNDLWTRLSASWNSFISDPIDAASGAHTLTKTLLTSKGAIDLNFDIKYNSLLLKNGIMGKAWGHNFEGSLVKKDANNIIINWGTNNNSTYTKNGTVYKSNNQFTPYEVISMDGTNYVLKKQDGTKYKFDSAGKLINIINRNNQALNLAYNASKQLTTVTEPISGKKLTFVYTNGKLTSVSDDLLRKVSFGYDANNNLTSITEANNYKVTYKQNTKGQITEATDSEARRLFTNTFDSNGRVIVQDDSIDGNQLSTFKYDETSQSGKIITTVTDRNGNSKVLTHDAKYRLLSVKDENGNLTQYGYDAMGNRNKITNAKNAVTTSLYDAKGNLKTTTDSLQRTTTFNYDANDNLLSLVNADNKTKSYTYDAKNNMLTETDSVGNITSYIYTNGFLTSKTISGQGTSKYEYTKGLLTKSTDPTGVYETYEYDAVGRTKKVINSVGKATSFDYDNNNNVTKTTNALNEYVSATYDGYGNKLTTTDAKGNVTKYDYLKNGKVQFVTDSKLNKTEYRYDGEERVTDIIDAKGKITHYTYDPKGRKIEVKDALGNIVKYSYDVLDNLETTTDAKGVKIATNEYDSVSNLTKTTDSLKRVVSYQYDKMNKIKVTTNPMLKNTTMYYDDAGKLTSVVDEKNQTSSQAYKNLQISSTTDLNGNVTSFNYDVAGRVKTQTNTSGKTITNNYNTLGQLQNTINGRLQTTAYTYDDAGKLKTVTDPVGAITYGYDANGNLTSIVDPKGTISYVYNKLNQVEQYTDVNKNVIKYEYDVNGNLTKLTYPDAKVVIYAYDEINRLKTVTDWTNKVTSYVYDANSRLDTTTNSDGTKVKYIYDAMGQLTTQTTTKGTTVIAKYIFGYDANGNVKTETRTGSETISYDYDDLDRMLTRTDKNASNAVIGGYTYTYDANGNIKTATPSNVAGLSPLSMTYGTGNQAKTFNTKALVFDADGNMTNGPIKGVSSTLSYDARNRLLSAGGLTYEYDSQNNRIAVTEGGIKTTKVINPIASLSQLLMEKDSTGKAIAYYVYGLGLIGTYTANGSYYTYHYDRRGSTIALTNTTGTVTDTYKYGPFGELLSKTGTTKNQFLYNGRDGVISDSNGLYYMRARYYSTDLKRFINQDTLLGGIGNGQSLNRFAYVNGNPVNMIDPNGLCAESDTWKEFQRMRYEINDPERNRANLALIRKYGSNSDVFMAYVADFFWNVGVDLFPAGKGTSFAIGMVKRVKTVKNEVKVLEEMNLQLFAAKGVNWKSVKKYGHTFSTHGDGAKNTRNLIGRAKSTGNNQGQWIDNQKTSEYLDTLGEIKEVKIVPIPEGYGQVITPKGEILPATQAIVVPSSSGIKSAYPIP